MATTQSDGSIILTTAIDQSGLKKGIGSIKSMAKTASKAFLAVGAAAATATIAIAKASVDAFAEYEQLVGGVETLFKGSSKKLIEYANQAYKTAGVSANEYMKQVTSFSASLIRSTAGDTDKAADIANMALIDISDNVNKMGSSMESVTLAYQGFAKQQYMLLDNLKLGYGGTKTEMERLLKDAEALTGVKYDISNLADVYTAIHVIQENLGIAGTTAKEAEKTISGSANMMKAAWQNVLTAISGGGDLDRAINNLVYSIQKYFENIVPVVERSLQGIGQLIERIAPTLVQTVARSLINAIPSLLNAVYQMIIGIAKGIYQGIIDLFSGGAEEALKAQTNEIAESVNNQEALTDEIKETEKAQKGALAGFDEINILTKSVAEAQTQNTGANLVGDIISNSDINTTKKANKELSVFDKILSNLAKVLKPLQNISLKNLSKSLKNLMKSLEPYKDLFLEGLSWLWNDVLVPMSQWTVENLIPAFLDTLSATLGFLTPVLEAIQPTLSWLWDEIFVPMASFVGDLFLDFLNLLTDAFTALSDWAKENPEDVKIMFDILISALAGIWVYNSAKKMIDFIYALRTAFIELGGIQGIMTALGTAINSTALAIGALAGAALFWVVNWDAIKEAFMGMEEWEKAIVVVAGLAAAIAVLWVASTVGLAAAGILAGLALLGLGAGILAMGSDNVGASTSGGAGSVPSQAIPEPPQYASGEIVPSNSEFLAATGNQNYGTTISAQNEGLQKTMEDSVEVQRDILNAIAGIEIGDDVIGKAATRYNNTERKMYGGGR